ncbi:MAG: PilZ domain-containing protein [Cellvibrionaceae bacterium]|nr:PilZ domain-containing protein [Cellvibrionaceae bacterium]
MNQITRDFQEKRNYIRMKVDTPVSIQIMSGEDTFEGICRDLSGGGLSVELSRTLPVGAVTQIAIASKHGHSPMLNARAVVTRVETPPSGKMSIVGMKIEEVLN